MTKQLRNENIIRSKLRNELNKFEPQKTGKNTSNKETSVSPF